MPRSRTPRALTLALGFSTLSTLSTFSTAVAGAPGLQAPPAVAAVPCAALVDLDLPDIRVTRAAVVAEPVPHCRVDGRIGGTIGFSVWLPEQWNGRFTMGGAGGFVAADDNQALRLARNVLERGYATAATDTGHRSDGMDGSWALDDLEAIVNYGHLGMHRAVVASKAVIAAHYGRAIDKSFFFGCSNGGRQALHEAQRYPGDFDAIVAGAPAASFSGVAAAFTQITAAMYPDPAQLQQPLVSRADRVLLDRAITAHCDARDGVADGILQDPTACDFDPASLQCGATPSGDCLDAARIAAIRTVYDGPRSPRGPLHVGFPFGAEAIDANGWGSWLTGGAASGSPSAAHAFGTGLLRYFIHHDPAWTWTGYDWADYPRAVRPVAAVLDATNPDLSAFRARGGKLLLYHGWSDVALSAHMSTGYVDAVYRHDPGARADVRLFMLPGVLHCYGGPGPSQVDWIDHLAAWHDSGEAPDDLVATWPDRPGERRICAWPQVATYAGGDPDTAAAWQCR